MRLDALTQLNGVSPVEIEAAADRDILELLGIMVRVLSRGVASLAKID
jgi:hypothetical protein